MEDNARPIDVRGRVYRKWKHLEIRGPWELIRGAQSINVRQLPPQFKAVPLRTRNPPQISSELPGQVALHRSSGKSDAPSERPDSPHQHCFGEDERD